MIAGHLGIALGARRFTHTVPLWLLLVAAQLPDWLDAGVCAVAPQAFPGQLWSHSIPAVLVGAVGIAGVYALFRRQGGNGAIVLALLVVSHILADYVTGIKPTWPGGPRVGLGLYSHPVLDALLETVIVACGWILYRRTLPERQRSGTLVVAPFALLAAGQVAVMAIALMGVMPGKC